MPNQSFESITTNFQLFKHMTHNKSHIASIVSSNDTRLKKKRIKLSQYLHTRVRLSCAASMTEEEFHGKIAQPTLKDTHTRYALVTDENVLEEKRKSAIPKKKPSKTLNGV